MRNFAVYCSIVFCILIACNGNNTNKTVLTSADGIEYVKLEPIIKDASGNSAAYKGYEIVDPGIQNMSAILLQIPKWLAGAKFLYENLEWFHSGESGICKSRVW
jgi:hypothetical protein